MPPHVGLAQSPLVLCTAQLFQCPLPAVPLLVVGGPETEACRSNWLKITGYIWLWSKVGRGTTHFIKWLFKIRQKKWWAVFFGLPFHFSFTYMILYFYSKTYMMLTWSQFDWTPMLSCSHFAPISSAINKQHIRRTDACVAGLPNIYLVQNQPQRVHCPSSCWSSQCLVWVSLRRQWKKISADVILLTEDMDTLPVSLPALTWRSATDVLTVTVKDDKHSPMQPPPHLIPHKTASRDNLQLLIFAPGRQRFGAKHDF